MSELLDEMKVMFECALLTKADVWLNRLCRWNKERGINDYDAATVVEFLTNG